MTLDEVKIGGECSVEDVFADGALGQRLLDMGFVPGTRIKIIRNAPLVDPVEIFIKGYFLSLRHAEAKTVEVVLL
ncbi:MAG: ferrous iron transport protein A [Candidatus Omnitrophica bacterium]|nr:ferrous iron transport protein A [Candidatus Omnitrophota bacterium]